MTARPYVRIWDRRSVLLGVIGLIGWGVRGTAASESVVLARWNARPQELIFASDNKSGLLAAWTIQESSGSWVGAQRSDYDGDQLWGEAGLRLGSPAGVKKDVRLAPDRRGGAILLWREEVDRKSLFYLQKLSPRGDPRWPDVGILVASCTLSSPMTLDVDEKGVIFMAWEAMENGIPRVRCQVADQEGRFKFGAGGRIVAAGATSLTAPAVIDDGEGGFFVVWQSTDSASLPLLAQYFDANQKPIWDPLGVAVTEHSALAEIRGCVYTPSDELVVLWSKRSLIGEAWYAQRMDASGQRQWGADGVSLVGEGIDQTASSVAVNHEGKITAAWEEADQQPHVVYAQRWLRAGLPVWGVSGTGIVEAPVRAQKDPLVAVGTRDAFVFWWEGRDFPWVLYAQRMKDDGTQTARDGIVLASLGSKPARLYGLPDSSGGVIVLWLEPNDTGSWHLQATRLKASGSLAW